MKDFRRLGPVYKLNEVPSLKSNFFEFKKLKGCTGSIFRRRLSIFEGKIFWHYAFFYGFSDNGECLVIENNRNGVECITWPDFILDFDYCELHHTEVTLDRFHEIINRAKEKVKLPYKGGENNCEHFVNYSVFGKDESMQANNIKQAVDLLFTIMETRIIMSPNPKDHEVLDIVDDLRNKLGVKRKEELARIIGKRKK